MQQCVGVEASEPSGIATYREVSETQTHCPVRPFVGLCGVRGAARQFNPWARPTRHGLSPSSIAVDGGRGCRSIPLRKDRPDEDHNLLHSKESPNAQNARAGHCRRLMRVSRDGDEHLSDGVADAEAAHVLNRRV